jgi:hypothetical protein
MRAGRHTVLYGDVSMAGKLAKTDYQILYRIICDCMPHAQRQKFLDLRTHNPEKAWQIVEDVWEEVISHIVQSFMKKEKEGAVDGQTKLIHREPWVN